MHKTAVHREIQGFNQIASRFRSHSGRHCTIFRTDVKLPRRDSLTQNISVHCMLLLPLT